MTNAVFKAELAVKDFAAGMGKVASVVANRVTLPILGMVLLKMEGATLSATGTTLAVTARAAIPAEGLGAVCAPAHLLHEAARRLPADARLVIEATGVDVRIRCGSTRLRFGALPAGDFPPVLYEETEEMVCLDLPGPAVAEALAVAADAACDDKVRAYLAGAFLHMAGDKLRIVGTDGHVMMVDEVAPTLPPTRTFKGVILPDTAIAAVRQVVRDAAVFTLGVTDERIMVRAGATTLWTKIVDGTYPEYERVIALQEEGDAGTTVTVDRDELARAIDRAGMISDDQGDKSRYLDARVEVVAGEMVITCRNQAGEEGVDRVTIDRPEGATVIGAINARYLAWALKTVGGETIDIRMRAAPSDRDPRQFLNGGLVLRRHGAPHPLRVVMNKRLGPGDVPAATPEG